MRIVLVLCALALPALGQQQPQTVTKVGTPATNAVTVQTSPSAPLAVTGSLSVSGAADTVGSSVAFNANSVCATVLLAGQLGAGFFLAAGTSAATYTPALSEDATPAAPGCTGGNWTASAFVDTSGNASGTISTTNPNAFQQYGIKTLAGSRCARVCTGGSGTTGTATGLLIATTVPSPAAAAGADVTDRAGRLVGHVAVDAAPTTAVTGTFWPTAAGTPGSFELSDGSAFYTGAKTGQLPAALDGSGFLKTHEQGTATISGTVAVSNSFALDATLTGGSQQAQVKSGAKGASAAALVTSTANGVDHQGLDVQVQNATLAATQSGTWTVQPGNTANSTAWLVTGAGGTFPVTGTVTTSPPANASTNVAQLAGTTTDTNSGTKSAGTLRVVLATDQPALTNKLLVTPDSVALPANQSVNVAQVAGTTTDTNSGLKSAGTMRIVLATDQPALTNKLLVTPDSVALPANQSVNVTQWSGTASVTGSGTATGALRVELANNGTGLVGLNAGTALVGKVGIDQTTPGTTNGVQDAATSATGSAVPAKAAFLGGGAAAGAGNLVGSTVKAASTASAATDTAVVVAVRDAFALTANQSVNVAQVGGTNTLTGGSNGSLGVGGLAADGSAVVGNPVLSAGKGFNGTANAPRYCDKIANVTTLSTTVTVQQIAGVANQKIYICGYYILASTATTAVTLKWTEGTGGACGTGTANVTPAIFTTPTSAPTVANFTLGPFGGTAMPWMSTAGDGLCITQSSGTNATTLSGVILYTQN
jgi:hypothetical protein